MESIELSYKNIDRCRACGGDGSRFDLVLELQPVPPAGLFCSSKDEALTTAVYPLHWVRCGTCGLVQVLEDLPDSALYTKYRYSSSTVPASLRHFDEFATTLKQNYGQDQVVRFLEIGCNDGILLKNLPEPWKKVGVDPSDVAQRAHNRAYQLVNAGFTSELVAQNKWEEKFDVITGSNCFAHISDLADVFRGIRHALKKGGEFWLEVHDLDSLLAEHQWDNIYHEHKVEWSERSVMTVLGAMQFSHMQTSRHFLQGGLLRMRFRKEAAKHSSPVLSLAGEPKLVELRDAFERRYDHPSIVRLLREMESGRIPTAYGAAGRANNYLNQMSRLSFRYIVDDSPLRCGLYLPKVAIPIVDRSVLHKDPGSVCLITAWNYAEDIKSRNSQSPIEWLTAFP